MAILTLRFFEIYTAVTIHFGGGKYDYFVHEGRTSVNANSFLKRKDKYLFENWKNKCPDENTAVGLCVSNNVIGNSYIRNYKMDVYTKWLGYRDALDYNFRKELTVYLEAKRQEKNKETLDLLLDLVIVGTLSKEFLILFNMVMSGELFKQLDDHNSFIWQDMKSQIIHYEPFLKYLWNLEPRVIKNLKNAAVTVKTVDKASTL